LIDYNKGVLTERLAGAIIALANTRSIPTFVDPKVNNYLKYRNCFCFKPNLYEGRVLTGRNNPPEVLQALQNTLNPKCIVLTCGAEGLYMTQPEPCTAAPLFHHMPHTQPVTVVDVTGAGDTAMSILVYLYCRDHCMRTACQAVNRICSKSVQCIGNYTLSVQDFYPDAPEKLLTVLKKTHRRCARIVFTNGCFDLIHAAHIQLLLFAKQQGDVLIVGLNSDASVRRLKGPTRPVNTERERIALLESLPWVDYVVPFDEDTPADLINVLRPHVLVKGGDYTHATIVGRDAVDEVIFFDYQKDRSSTGMIDRILALQEQKAEAEAKAWAEADIISV
jgi:D-beta-D-heptose 7-phosphate kinase/D-beta-D-heptose 1-phosphate adenosyltransferase